MKKRLLGLIFAPILLLTGCKLNNVAVSGDVIDKEILIENINKISISDIYLQNGNTHFGPTVYVENDETKKPKVIIKSPESLVDKINVKANENSLKISASPFDRYITDVCQIYVYNCVLKEIDLDNAVKMLVSSGTITDDNIKIDLKGASSISMYGGTLNKLSISVSGASSFSAEMLRLNDLEADISGASSVFVNDFQADEVFLDISGASSCEAKGVINLLDLDVSGASQVRFIDAPITNCNGELSGASVAYITINSNLKLELSGASLLYYKGDIKNIDVNLSGGSSIKSYN